MLVKNTILVTGFGPFGEHQINASWECVKLLDELSFDGYKLIIHEVPVTYDYVNQNIKELWKKYEPTFVLHVGVGVTKEGSGIALESVARRKPYLKVDAEGKYHPTGEVCPSEEGPDTHYPDLHVQSIVEELNSEELRFILSKDAGLYLCEYIFYTSLNIDKNRILFAHVPPLDKPYTAETLAEGLTKVIISALRQLNDNSSNNL